MTDTTSLPSLIDVVDVATGHLRQVRAHAEEVEKIEREVEKAAHILEKATTADEVLKAKQIAEQAYQLGRMIDAANETKADCLRIITRAESRLAREIDAGQASGALADHGGDRKSIKPHPTLRVMIR
jgi:hypothetical protein